MNNELFELCKEVYKRFPRWTTGEWIDYYEGRFTTYKASHNDYGDYQCPLYTSDYLLEKLPPGLDLFKRPNSYVAIGPGDDPSVHQSDTPLKALLKLVLALPNEYMSKGVHR